MEAYNKLKNILHWLDYQNADFGYQFKNIEQLEKVYDYAQKNNFEFLDDEYIEDYFTKEEKTNFDNFLKEILKN